MKKWTQHLLEHGQTGQALVILALGFIGLIGFVGIVTDVSLMFVRYSTLSRAVDSAAIAAAGQMRSDRDIADVNLAARQYIEFHGLDPLQVRVDTCETTRRYAADGSLEYEDPDICTKDQRKLVRVGAKVNSPTVFMRLLGFGDITLEAVSISETAVLDVVMILDVSESMLFDTTYADWAKIGYGQVYVPPKWGEILQKNIDRGDFITGRPNTNIEPDPDNNWQDVLQFWWDLLNQPQEVINQRLYYTNNPSMNSAIADPNYNVSSFAYPGSGSQQHPRRECSVRFWPYSESIKVSDNIKELYRANGHTWSDQTWQGFVPAYDFYGCCNDPTVNGYIDENGNLRGSHSAGGPTGDFNFSDLICQPFKQARDATREFLKRIDFGRGDRVSLVTFDRGAFLVDPDGVAGSLDAGCPGESIDQTTGRTNLSHMIESACRAERTLNQFIGVRAEPNFYVWKPEGGWNGFANGLDPQGNSKQINYYGTNPDNELVQRAKNVYPVRDHCDFQSAALGGFQSLYSLWDWNWKNPVTFSNDSGLYRIMNPNPYDGAWAGQGLDHRSSYELWANCRGTNMGAALRTGNNALLDPATTRRTGTVWVMIMLSDGAAGASDPVRLNGEMPEEARPYYDRLVSGGPGWATWKGQPVVRYGLTGEYGVYGVCPLGTPDNPSQLTRPRAAKIFPYCGDERPETRHSCRPPNNDAQLVGGECVGSTTATSSTWSSGFAPGSLDNRFECSREFDENLQLGRVYDLDIGNYPNDSSCSSYYDVDDYARDWADYVGLTDVTSGDVQLPTIFTIGFGLDFRVGSSGDPSSANYVPGSAADNTPDFLGEELLRYIADVGDNFQLDSDYQQDWYDNGQLNGTLQGDTFGLRGPCEDQTLSSPYTGDLLGNGYSTRDGGTGSMVRPLPPREDCGNYYNAPDQTRLSIVFNNIASRMFTRLAG